MFPSWQGWPGDAFYLPSAVFLKNSQTEGLEVRPVAPVCSPNHQSFTSEPAPVPLQGCKQHSTVYGTEVSATVQCELPTPPLPV